jgi:hypothetical protein
VPTVPETSKLKADSIIAAELALMDKHFRRMAIKFEELQPSNQTILDIESNAIASRMLPRGADLAKTLAKHPLPSPRIARLVTHTPVPPAVILPLPLPSASPVFASPLAIPMHHTPIPPAPLSFTPIIPTSASKTPRGETAMPAYASRSLPMSLCVC